jgi:thioredoxin-dependent peroxiredoxin
MVYSFNTATLNRWIEGVTMLLPNSSTTSTVRASSRIVSFALEGEPMLRSGDNAPLFSLPDADMENFDMASVRGNRHVVLFFYPRDNTPSCTLQAADFSDHEDVFNRLDCIVVGVSPDDSLTHAEFRDEHGLSIRLLADTEAEACKLFGVWREKVVDGVKRMGVLRSTFIIDKTGQIRHALYDVAPRGHVAEVLALVRELEPEKANANRKKHRRNA